MFSWLKQHPAVQSRFDINAPIFRGHLFRTVLCERPYRMLAPKTQSHEILALLLEAKADVFAKDSEDVPAYAHMVSLFTRNFCTYVKLWRF